MAEGIIGQMMVSVIVVTYNHEKYISQALKSIVAQQTRFPFEIIVGEDCSTDRTRLIVQEYEKNFPDLIKPVYHRKNQGATQNGIACFSKAKGKYLAFCDGDDFWCDPTRLQYEVDYLETHPGLMGINNYCRIVDEDGISIPAENIGERLRFWNSPVGDYGLKDFEAWRLPGHISALMCRNIFLESPKDMELFTYASSIVGDRSNILLLVLKGKIHCDDRVVSCYRFRNGIRNANFMAVYKQKNLKDEDFLMLCRMEEWTWEHKGVRIDLTCTKKDRLAGAVVVFMKQPTLYNAGVIRRIMKYSGMPFRYFLYAIKAWLLKMYYWYVLNEDKPLVL